MFQPFVKPALKTVRPKVLFFRVDEGKILCFDKLKTPKNGKGRFR